MAVPKLSKYIIRVSMMILTKNKRAKVVVFRKDCLYGSFVENTFRNKYKIVTEISEEKRLNSLTGSE